MILQRRGHSLTFWGHAAAHLAEMKRSRRNERYLPGEELPAAWAYEADLRAAISGSEGLVIAVPSKTIRVVAHQVGDYPGNVVSVTKGIEFETALTMSGVLRAAAPASRHCPVHPWRRRWRAESQPPSALATTRRPRC